MIPRLVMDTTAMFVELRSRDAAVAARARHGHGSRAPRGMLPWPWASSSARAVAMAMGVELRERCPTWLPGHHHTRCSSADGRFQLLTMPVAAYSAKKLVIAAGGCILPLYRRRQKRMDVAKIVAGCTKNLLRLQQKSHRRRRRVATQPEHM